MDSTVIVLIVIIVLLVLALGAAGVVLSRRRRSERLQEHYGPEYERSVRETGDRRAAEAELTTRERRVAELDIRDLRPEEREQYRATWADVQQGFVDDPVRSVHAADRLVTDIMRTRGYPVDDFDRRAEDISVAHPDVVQHYREARAVREATDNDNRVDTDQQRKAVTSYRSLVDALLGSDANDDERRSDGRHRDRHTDDRRIDERQYDDDADRRRTDDDVRDDRSAADDHRLSHDRHAERARGRPRPARPSQRGAHSMSTSEQHTDVSRHDPLADEPSTADERYHADQQQYGDQQQQRLDSDPMLARGGDGSTDDNPRHADAGDLLADDPRQADRGDLADDSRSRDDLARDDLRRDDVARDDVTRDDLARDDLARDDLARVARDRDDADRRRTTCAPRPQPAGRPPPDRRRIEQRRTAGSTPASSAGGATRTARRWCRATAPTSSRRAGTRSRACSWTSRGRPCSRPTRWSASCSTTSSGRSASSGRTSSRAWTTTTRPPRTCAWRCAATAASSTGCCRSDPIPSAPPGFVRGAPPCVRGGRHRRRNAS